MHVFAGRRADLAVGGAVFGDREKALAKACFFKVMMRKGGGEDEGLVRGDGVHAHCIGRKMALGNLGGVETLR